MAPRKRRQNKTESKAVPKRSKTDAKHHETDTKSRYSFRERKTPVVNSNDQISNKIIKKSKYFSDDTNDDEESNEECSIICDTKITKTSINNDKSDSDSDSKDDWEEVMDNPVSPDVDLNDYHPELPKEGVEITLDDPLLRKKKKKKSFDVNEFIRLRVNKFKKELQLNRHKTSLLLLMARGIYLNKLTDDHMVRALSMSFVVNQTFIPLKAKPKLKFINDFVVWFTENFKLDNEYKDEPDLCAHDIVCDCLTKRVTSSVFGYVLSFISLLRAIDINMNVRLCYALNAVQLFAEDLILTANQSKKIKKPSVKESENNSSAKQQPTNKKVKSKPKKTKSLDGEVEEVEAKENYTEYWAEIFLESEKRWICCDIVEHIIDKRLEIGKNASNLLTYVLAFDSDHYIKEVTARYSNDWMTKAMKQRRVTQEWWSQCLSPFSANPDSCYEKLEAEEFESFLSEKPLPQKVGDYKNHPLYVLKKDLLKYQGIYPSDAPTLGFFKEQPVYARECVFTLRGIEAWKRFAKVVKAGESPYKMVTSRPKWDRCSKTWKHDLPLELYGEWQTEDYIPPKAENGIVPRNSYGNVELFQKSMLPVGTVYLQLPGLLRIASKLKIDCAPAVVGFDNNLGGCGSHPTIDGFVVCEEFKEILIDAWEEEQENARQRELQRREKRVYDNWKKLIKGLLIREKLKLKYNTEQRNVNDSETTKQ